MQFLANPSNVIPNWDYFTLNNTGMTVTNDPIPEDIELSIPEALRVVEETVKFLNKKNNELQQHIRTNKDKENQKTRDEIDKVIKLLKPQLEQRRPDEINTYTESIDEGKRRNDVITKIKLLEQILEKSVGKFNSLHEKDYEILQPKYYPNPIKDLNDIMNQKIVDELKKIESVVLPYNISPNDARFIRYDYVRNLIKKTTGKDIKDL